MLHTQSSSPHTRRRDLRQTCIKAVVQTLPAPPGAKTMLRPPPQGAVLGKGQRCPPRGGRGAIFDGGEGKGGSELRSVVDRDKVYRGSWPAGGAPSPPP
eukprot:gene18355-biopygen9946